VGRQNYFQLSCSKHSSDNLLFISSWIWFSLAVDLNTLSVLCETKCLRESKRRNRIPVFFCILSGTLEYYRRLEIAAVTATSSLMCGSVSSLTQKNRSSSMSVRPIDSLRSLPFCFTACSVPRLRLIVQLQDKLLFTLHKMHKSERSLIRETVFVCVHNTETTKWMPVKFNIWIYITPYNQHCIFNFGVILLHYLDLKFNCTFSQK
jgi:hypothetical protein